jgi:hypothetical protein
MTPSRTPAGTDGPVSSRDETREGPSGRPRQWSTPAEKHRAFRKRQAEQRELVAELLLAVRNARLEETGDPELRRAGLEGDDPELLRALVRHYEARHWHRGRKGGTP